ncbi:hypothetical protein BaRGS_00032999 [Batillaria attramentaria]|uniref:Uncharacterized protein n=1 Tax=Batillaria attramentaria TaxID=370345 RepID=A0ABD0JL91_9CAEN
MPKPLWQQIHVSPSKSSRLAMRTDNHIHDHVVKFERYATGHELAPRALTLLAPTSKLSRENASGHAYQLPNPTVCSFMCCSVGNSSRTQLFIVSCAVLLGTAPEPNCLQFHVLFCWEQLPNPTVYSFMCCSAGNSSRTQLFIVSCAVLLGTAPEPNCL